MIREASYTSVWDGGHAVTSPCMVNTETHEVFNIEVVEDCDSLIPRAAVLMRKYIDNDDGWTYHRDYAISEAISEYRRMNK